MSLIVVTVILLMLYLTMVIGQNKKSMPQIYIPRDCQDGNIDLILEDVNNSNKINALRELRMFLNLDLRTCKYIIDNTPIMILKNMNESQAQSLQEKFNNIGLKVSFKNNLS